MVWLRDVKWFVRPAWSTAVMLSFRLSRHVMKAAVVSETLRALPPPPEGAPRPCSTVAGTPLSISRFSAKLHCMLYCRAKPATSGTCREAEQQ